jgi:Ca-activated chloride channel family protein
MKWALPWVLLAAGLVPVIMLLLQRWSEARARKKLNGLVAPRLREQLLRSVDFAKRWRKALVLALAFALLFVAVARPQLGFQDEEVERGAVDFIIALDLSRSMLAEDMETKARLTAAKAGIVKLLDTLDSDRAGLIAFAGDTFLAAPVTQDHEAVKRNLDALQPQSIAKQGSDLAKAIQLALKTFEAGKYEGKALILVTDGEELQGDAVVAAREASLKGLWIFTVGVGSPAGSRIPLPRPIPGGGGFAKNEFGGEVMTRLNERVLQQLAASGRGTYRPLGKDGEGLIETWKQGIVPLSKGTQTKKSKDLQERFQWPLAVALALLLTEMLVSDRRTVLKTTRA